MTSVKDFSIKELENELARRKQEPEKAKPRPLSASWPKSPIGRWKVTTEGDCEGRTTKNLGTYDGHVADIAFRLGDRSGYTLRFEPANQLPELPELKEKTKKVCISLGIDSGTWDCSKGVMEESIGVWLASSPSKDVNFKASLCNYFAGVTLERCP